MIKFTDYSISGVDYDDCPDFVDAYICSAVAIEPDGTVREATDEELDVLNEDADLVQEVLYNFLY